MAVSTLLWIVRVEWSGVEHGKIEKVKEKELEKNRLDTQHGHHYYKPQRRGFPKIWMVHAVVMNSWRDEQWEGAAYKGRAAANGVVISDIIHTVIITSIGWLYDR